MAQNTDNFAGIKIKAGISQGLKAAEMLTDIAHFDQWDWLIHGVASMLGVEKEPGAGTRFKDI